MIVNYKFYDFNMSFFKNIVKKYEPLSFYETAYEIIPKIQVSRYYNDYYQMYLKKYVKDGMIFKLKRFYGINWLAFLFGPIFYIYGGLYLGLFFYLFISMVTLNIFAQIDFYFLNFIHPILLINLISGLLANYFIILKVEKNIIKSLKYTKSKKLIVDYTNQLNLSNAYNLAIGIPFFIFCFYLALFVGNPIYFLNPINSIDVINTDLNQTTKYLSK